MTIKEQLYTACRDFLMDKIQSVEASLQEIQEAAGQETKSSAGDKYETAREMMQQERNKWEARLALLKSQLQELNYLERQTNGNTVQPGCIIETDKGYFLLGPAIGKVENALVKLMCISPGAPLGQALLHKKAGAPITLNGNTYHLISLY